MSGFLVFPEDDSRFDGEDVKRFLLGLDGARDIKINIDAEQLISCVFAFGREEVEVELGENLEAIVLDPDNEAALEFSVRLQGSIATSLRIVDEVYSFDSLLKKYASMEDLKRDYQASWLESGR